MKERGKLTVSELRQVLGWTGIELKSDIVETLYQDPDVLLAINEDFIDDLFRRLIDAKVLDPQSVSDQKMWEAAKQYLYEQRKLTRGTENGMTWREILGHWTPICALGAILFGTMVWCATYSLLWTLLGIAGGAALVLIIIAIAGSENENFRKEGN